HSTRRKAPRSQPDRLQNRHVGASEKISDRGDAGSASSAVRTPAHAPHFTAATPWTKDQGQTRLRIGVDERNDAASEFWASLGYREVDVRQRPSPSGPLSVSVRELDLDA
ncbi:MAG TPA: hypothetical protein VIM19_16505, partial [Actinomycetes bacterium]